MSEHNNLLSKEQAAFVLHKIKNNIKMDLKDFPLRYVDAQLMEELILSCVKKEFPEFIVTHDKENRTHVKLGGVNWGNNIIMITHLCAYAKIVEAEEEHFYSFAEFKEFTRGCQLIVEWLESPNESK